MHYQHNQEWQELQTGDLIISSSVPRRGNIWLTNFDPQYHICCGVGILDALVYLTQMKGAVKLTSTNIIQLFLLKSNISINFFVYFSMNHQSL